MPVTICSEPFLEQKKPDDLLKGTFQFPEDVPHVMDPKTLRATPSHQAPRDNNLIFDDDQILTYFIF